MLFRRLQSAFCRLYALYHHASGIRACIHLYIAKVAIALGLTRLRHWCTSIPIQNYCGRNRVQILSVGTTTTFSPRIWTPTTIGKKQGVREMMTMVMVVWMWLAREPGAGSGERGAGIKTAGSRDCRKKSRNR
jgi:hypothetical protein